MTRIRQIKTTFTSGEVSPDLLGRGDLRAYENGAAKLRNVFIQPTGGIKRRAIVRWSRAGRGGLWLTQPLDRADLESIHRFEN